MSLKPIDSSSLRDPQPSNEQFRSGATGIHHYVTPQTDGGRSDKGRNRDPRKTRALALTLSVVAVVAVLVVGFVVVRHFGADTSWQVALEQGTPVDVTIPTGSGDGDIAQIMQSAGVIASTTEFMNAVSTSGADGTLKSGTYHLTAGMAPADVVAELVKGPDAISVTIPEGLTVAQTADRVQAALGISTDDFLAQAKASYYTTDYTFLSGAYNDSLEGFLFPDTYQFDESATADQVIRAMLDEFKSVTSTLDFSTATQGDTALSEYQVIVMASMIEKETAQSSERPLIASVMYNRLNIGMYLQIDATVNYALGKYDLLTEADLAVDSPYNTYLYQGLPVGPICSPSLDSIKAAAAPATTDYIYYVASSALDGTHVFCATEEEFAQARDAYNQAMGIS